MLLLMVVVVVLLLPDMLCAVYVRRLVQGARDLLRVPRRALRWRPWADWGGGDGPGLHPGLPAGCHRGQVRDAAGV